MRTRGKLGVNLFETRICRHCGHRFAPRYANQQVHGHCWFLWRREYQKRYQQTVRKSCRLEEPA